MEPYETQWKSRIFKHQDTAKGLSGSHDGAGFGQIIAQPIIMPACRHRRGFGSGKIDTPPSNPQGGQIVRPNPVMKNRLLVDALSRCHAP